MNGTLGLATLATLLAADAVGACGAQLQGSDPIGQGGSGGDVTGEAGTTGGGGAVGTAGTTGAGGTGAVLGCQVSDVAPGDPVISRFSAELGGMPLLSIGGTFMYPSNGDLSAVVNNGAWHLTARTTGMPSAQYWGFGIYFSGNAAGTDCIDATAHTGVQFDIWGRVDGIGCTAQYSTNDSAHTNSAVDVKGSGDPASYAPQAPLMVTDTPTTLEMPFAGPGAPTGGSPAIPVDKSKLTGVQWQFTTAAGADSSCDVDVMIASVMFY